jgi:hypothetical protein
MPDVAPAVAARLRELAVNDAHPGAREACAAALRAHREDGQIAAAAPAPARERWSARLLTTAIVTRSDSDDHARFEPRYPDEAPALRGRLYADPAGARLELSGLPPDFVGTSPVVRGRRASGVPAEVIAAADAPVSAERTVTMTIRLEGATIDDLAAWLRESDLVVPAD